MSEVARCFRLLAEYWRFYRSYLSWCSNVRNWSHSASLCCFPVVTSNCLSFGERTIWWKCLVWQPVMLRKSPPDFSSCDWTFSWWLAFQSWWVGGLPSFYCPAAPDPFVFAVTLRVFPPSAAFLQHWNRCYWGLRCLPCHADCYGILSVVAAVNRLDAAQTRVSQVEWSPCTDCCFCCPSAFATTWALPWSPQAFSRFSSCRAQASFPWLAESDCSDGAFWALDMEISVAQAVLCVCPKEKWFWSMACQTHPSTSIAQIGPGPNA